MRFACHEGTGLVVKENTAKGSDRLKWCRNIWCGNFCGLIQSQQIQGLQIDEEKIKKDNKNFY